MKRIVSAADGVVFLPADANAWQDKSQGLLAGSDNNDFAAAVQGVDSIVWQGQIAAATPTLLDDAHDWRDRLVWGWARFTASSSDRVGQSTDYNLNAAATDGASGVGTSYGSSSPAAPFYGYTGVGAYSNITTGAAVGAGAAPLNDAGVFRSYAVFLAQDAAFATLTSLFVHPSTGALYAYNGEAVGLYLILVLMATSDLGKR